MNELEPSYNELKILLIIRQLKPYETLEIAKNQNGQLLTITRIPKPERTSFEIGAML